MVRFFGITVLLLFPLILQAGEKGPPIGWKVVPGGFKKEAYEVWLPASGKIDEAESNIVAPTFGQIRVFRSVTRGKDGTVFGAGQIILPPKLIKETPKVRQDFFRDNFLDEVNGKLVEEKNIKLDTMPGKEYVVKTPTGMARYRLYGTGVMIFRTLVIGSKAKVEGQEAEMFFSSFKRKLPGDVAVAPKPGPDVPVKAFTKPAKAAAPTSYLKIVSSPGDFIGRGMSYDYKGDQLTLKKTPRGINVRVDGWTLDIAGPKGQFPQVGEYREAKRAPFNGESPGLNFSGKGRGSNKLSGEFVVWELEVTGDQITRLAIDFVQRSEGAGPPLTGQLRFNSSHE